MDITAKDVGPHLVTFPVCNAKTATAASTGDGTEVTGEEIDLDGIVSGKLVITYTTTLTSEKTLTFATQQSDAPTTGGSYTADVDVQTATLAATGPQTAFLDTFEVDVPDCSQFDRFLKFKITPEMNADNTDTVAWSACFVGLKKNV